MAPLKKYLKRKLKKYMKKRKSRVPRSLPLSRQTANITETMQILPGSVDGTSGFPNQIFNRIFALAQFPRAMLIAPNFRYYRAKKVTWTYTPFSNVFQQFSGTTAPDVSIPYLYTVMNRTQDAYPLGIIKSSQRQSMEAMGCKPRTFTKKIVMSYRPNWCQAGAPLITLTGTPPNNAVTSLQNTQSTPSYKKVACTNYSVSGGPLITPVVPDPNTVSGSVGVYPVVFGDLCVWGGHLDYIYQANTIADELLYNVECTVDWEFSEPNFIMPGPREPPPTDVSGTVL